MRESIHLLFSFSIFWNFQVTGVIWIQVWKHPFFRWVFPFKKSIHWTSSMSCYNLLCPFSLSPPMFVHFSFIFSIVCSFIYSVLTQQIFQCLTSDPRTHEGLKYLSVCWFLIHPYVSPRIPGKDLSLSLSSEENFQKTGSTLLPFHIAPQICSSIF